MAARDETAVVDELGISDMVESSVYSVEGGEEAQDRPRAGPIGRDASAESLGRDTGTEGFRSFLERQARAAPGSRLRLRFEISSRG